MRSFFIASFLGLLSLAASAQEDTEEAPPSAVPVAAPDTRLFELRTTTPVEGKFQPLLARFRDHALRLFEKHGMTNVGYWVPADNPEGQLIYLLAHRDRAARDAAWRAFLADPEWQAVMQQSEADGELISSVEEQFLVPTAFSPRFDPSVGETVPRLFELRTYIAMPGSLPALHARFRDVTLRMFAKHGMTNLGYFQLAPGQAGAEQTLVYFLAHDDLPSATSSWDTFQSDPEWIAAKQASEVPAGGPLTVVDGIKSTFLIPADFSPTR